jgi:hypothetical protein
VLCPAGANTGSFSAFASSCFRSVDPLLDSAHGGAGSLHVLFRRELSESRGCGKFDVQADAIGPTTSFLNQGGRRFGDRLQVNVTAELMTHPQRARDRDDLLHGVIRIANDSRTEEQAFDVIAPIKLERQTHHFLGRKPRSLHVARHAIDAVEAVVDAVIREENFQERNATPIGRVAVANPGPDR